MRSPGLPFPLILSPKSLGPCLDCCFLERMSEIWLEAPQPPWARPAYARIPSVSNIWLVCQADAGERSFLPCVFST